MKFIRRRTVNMSMCAVTVIVAAVFALVLTTMGCTRPGPPDSAPDSPSVTPVLLGTGAPVPPAHGAYFGARAQPRAYTQPAITSAVSTLQQEIGRRLDIVHVYAKWHDPFPAPSDLVFLRQGSMLLLSWSGADTAAIASGAYDNWIRQRALAIRATGKPVFLEWRWEMDRPGLSTQVHSPAQYIAAWDHIRSIFSQEHANNVAWVWCPTAEGFADGTAAAYYPGDREVGWVCADAYPGPGPYRSFAAIIQPFLSWASHHPKPIIIGEYGVPQTYGLQARAEWLRAAARTVQNNPRIKAIVYFDGNAKHAYALTAHSAPLQAFRDIASESYFNTFHRPTAGG